MSLVRVEPDAGNYYIPARGTELLPISREMYVNSNHVISVMEVQESDGLPAGVKTAVLFSEQFGLFLVTDVGDTVRALNSGSDL